MEKEIAIKIEGLSKQYTIGKQKDGSLRGTLNGLFKSSKGDKETFTALTDINLEIKRGDVVGIIGRNGAGKSTLLKILSKITKPTKGRAEINGRVASLLEVGTGFHPELTGRENIYLNGTILGMTRKEVKAKFDEIVEFSGVQKFIDTPVKHYSSGMYVRLAFAVAAHLEPEILIIDEVLAVGDAEFQKKCLGKMKDVAGQGRTVLFVSHDLAAVEGLCNRCVYLAQGQVRVIGETSSVLSEYYKSISNTKNLAELKDREGNNEVFVERLEWLNTTEGVKDSVISCQEIKCTIRLNKKVTLSDTKIDIGVNNEKSQRVAWLSSRMLKDDLESDRFNFVVKNFNLCPGEYTNTIYIETKNELNDWVKEVSPFTVEQKDYYGAGKSIPKLQGQIILDYVIEEN